MVGEEGFGRVVAIAESSRQQSTNLVEVAFSVSMDFKNKGLGKLLLKKITEAAREHGARGMIAYTVQTNRAMIDLFNNLPYKVTKQIEEDTIVLTCFFDELA